MSLATRCGSSPARTPSTAAIVDSSRLACDQLVEAPLRRLRVGQDDPIKRALLLCRSEITDDRHADTATAGPRRIDDADHLDLALAGAQDGDFRQIAGAAERHPRPA